MIKKVIISVFYRSWWVIAFSLFCGILYENGLKAREVHYQQLKEQLLQLQTEKQQSIERQKNLRLQINSQTDEAWQELTLIRVLGLVPENTQKVFFIKTER